MEQLKITIIRVGHSRFHIDFDRITNRKSKLFTIRSMSTIDHMPDSDIDDGYLNQKFSEEALISLLSCPENSDIAIAIIPYKFEDNFYMKRITPNCVVISLYGISEILERHNISIENFIIKQLYEICVLKHIVKDISINFDVLTVVHRDTRGCLFDLNGDRSDIIYNTEKPILCDSCKDRLKETQIDVNAVRIIEVELSKIRKPFMLRIENWIKTHPFISISISISSAIILNIIASLILRSIDSCSK